MATFEASAEKRGKAIDSLAQTMSDLSEALSVEPVTIPTRAFDAITLQAIQLEALSEWAVNVAAAVQGKLAEKTELETANADLVTQVEALSVKEESIIGQPVRPAAAKKSK